MNAMKVTRTMIALYVLPCLLLFLAVVFIPIVVSVYYSFMQWNGIGGAKWIGLHNYSIIFTKDNIFWSALSNSWKFALFSVAEIAFALWIAILLSRYVKRSSFLVSVYFVPVILSVVIVGQLWKNIYNPLSFGGLLNSLLTQVGLSSWTHGWLSETNTSMYAIIFIAIWQYLGYNILILYTGVQNISNDIYEAAKIDGADGIKADWYITLPLAVPVIKICVIIAVIGSLNALDLIMVVSGGGPGHATEVISSYMYNKTFLSMQYGYGSALSVILVVQCLVATLVLNLIFKRSEKNALS
ncbi:sugar ABC transporter permease [Paenibacillus baekrokdamisoli]|uniref:Sugar ABC transporter permease n=1 Tax=Paenibacillus baekrokdamisoli TaxID=1712516 RepID=A0A3G9IW16_9BACL|nr:sugar ABC transporter permease [Paenibacillus baekrokdamisoli]MBB3072044.1 raffinose/stachyose/melibiose transport system permease protein [Paenibacillus baekrokdamisoli]BBH20345.1 sugar ABC transporter permease [Paenibacillus baekrokdamisoli]